MTSIEAATKESLEIMIDSIFSQDFEKMNIEQLQIAQNDIGGLFSTSNKNKMGIRLTDEQLQKKYVLDYLLSKDEYRAIADSSKRHWRLVFNKQ